MTDPAADDATGIQEVAGTFGSRKRSGAWTTAGISPAKDSR
jgi:hypothetical protein